jgi:two-component system chemotaxis sensor kinase CheA
MTWRAESSELLSEAQDLIEDLSRCLSLVDEALNAQQVPDPEHVDGAFRAVHTLKSLAGMFDADTVSSLAHDLETTLAALRLGKIELEPAVLDVLFDAAEAFPQLLAAFVGETEAPVDVDSLRARVLGLGTPGGAAASQAPVVAEEAPMPPGVDPAILAVLTEFEEHRLRENVRLGRRLVRVHVSFDLAEIGEGIDAIRGELKAFGEVIAYVPSADASAPDRIDFDIILGSDRSLAELGEGVATGTVHDLVPVAAPPRVEPPPPPVAPVPHETVTPDLHDASSTVKVDLSRLDHLMNLVGELGVVQANLGDSLERVRALEGASELRRSFQGHLRAMDRQLSLLQQGLLEVRMVPLDHEFQRLGRAARKLGRQLGKEVVPRIFGAETELDKLIVETLSQALMHLLRNAVDHGIELPAERVRAGKPPVGTITLRAFQQGNRVVVEMEDDGRGMDWRVLRDVAVRKGLIDAEVAAELGEAESIDLIYLKGFTTTTEVTDTSGRAYGMDIVKTSVLELSGMIDIDTKVGRGTRFSIVLPVTLAIIQALVIDAGGQTFCIPLGSVLESIMVRKADLSTLGGHVVVSLRGRTLPLVHLSRLFELSDYDYADPDRIYVVIVGLAHHRVGLVVDELRGQQDVVIKPLGSALRAVPGLAGATELGANRTVLLLDIATLVDEAMTRTDLGAWTTASTDAREDHGT